MTVIALAGATGYTGQRIISQAANNPEWQVRALVRQSATSKSHFPLGQAFAICDFADQASVEAALEGCEAVFQTIGTTQAQFNADVSYETVDYGTTIALIKAAQVQGVKRFVLLSSAGAGLPLGSYLRWKAKTEKAVRESGLDWTILRPAAIVGPSRRAIQLASMPFALLSKLPLIGRLGAVMRPVDVNDLALSFFKCLADQTTIGKTLEGRSFWRLIR